MSSREIITIQCGHYSNFVGTHWWNLQESAFCYDASVKEPAEIYNDCTFREGLTLNGDQTYTPRLISVDKSGSLGCLRRGGILYEDPQLPHHDQEDDVTWKEGVKKHVFESPKKNEFLTDLEKLEAGQMKIKEMEEKAYNLQGDVEVWSDFLRIHLHPRSVLTLPGVFHGDESSFKIFPSGQEVWTTQFRDTFEDQLHFFAEECDSLQGFQLLVDVGDGFGGLASCFAEELVDNFSQKGLLSFMLSPDVLPWQQSAATYSHSLLNYVLSLDSLCEHSSLVCPLSVLEQPWTSHSHSTSTTRLRFEKTMPFHSSAMFAAALETASLVYRACHAPLSLPSLTSILTNRGRKLCSMGLCLPLSLPTGSSLLTELDVTPLHARLQPLTPFCSTSDHVWTQAISLRGLPSNYPLCPLKDKRHTYCSQQPSLALGTHLSAHFPHTPTHFAVVHKALILGNPFPDILPYQHKTQDAACASFHSSSGLLALLDTLSVQLGGVNMHRAPQFADTCLDGDSHRELGERLLSLTDCYKTKQQLDELSDSD